MDFPSDPSGTSLYSAKEEDTSDIKLRIAFKKTVHQHKWLVSHFTFSDELYILHSDFESGELMSGSAGYYSEEV